MGIILNHDEMLKYINETPEVQSLLYDIDLLPEQVLTTKSKQDYMRMLAIVSILKRSLQANELLVKILALTTDQDPVFCEDIRKFLAEEANVED